MKYKLLLTACITFTIFLLNGQNQFQNPSFEEWEPIKYGSIPEPVNWSSIRTAEPDNLAKIAPAVWGQSDDAHTGNYSLYLTNIAIFGIVATGTITNGRIVANLNPDLGNSHTDPDSAQWNMPLNQRPDSVVGWYKCKPSPGDFPTAKVLIHKGYAALPQEDSSNWIGVAYIELSSSEVTEWTRFSVPFEYFDERTPEFFLTILTAGNGTTAVANSEAWFDDLKLIFNGTPVDEINAEDFQVYASHGQLNVFLDADRGNSKLQVVDLSGREVLSGELINGEANRFKMDVPDGVYVATVYAEGSMLSKKVYIRK